MNWKIHAYVLIVEQRHCEACGNIHESPALEPRVLLQNEEGATQTCSFKETEAMYGELGRLLQKPLALPTVPRYLKTVTVHVPVCQHCFHLHEPQQKDFWPSRTTRDTTTVLRLIKESEVRAAATEQAAIDALLENEEPLWKRNLKKSRRAKEKKKKPVVKPLDLSQF